MGRAAFLLYGAAMYLLLPAVLLRYIAKGFRQSAYFDRFAERFGTGPKGAAPGAVWVHAVSVGEVNAATPLVNALLRQNRRVLITCVTPTGSAQIRKTFGDTVESCYAPIDAGVFVSMFLSKVQPKALVILETEIWPNMIRACAIRGIAVYFANMRISNRTFRKARRMRALFAYVTSSVEHFNVQTETDSSRISSLGVESARTSVTGNLKFETAVAEDLHEQGAALRKRLGVDRPAMVLGSSHQGEEEIVIDVFRRLREDYPLLVCIVVPRHPERFDPVCKVLEDSGFRVLRRTEWGGPMPGDSVDVALVDTMGELMSFYSACDVAIVGGSLVDIGGHNVLEPIAAERPVVFGPWMSNFTEIAKLVVEQQAGRQVRDPDELYFAVKSYFDDETLRDSTVARGRELIRANRGALRRTMENLAV